jgi:hypothetical protein
MPPLSPLYCACNLEGFKATLRNKLFVLSGSRILINFIMHIVFFKPKHHLIISRRPRASAFGMNQVLFVVKHIHFHDLVGFLEVS